MEPAHSSDIDENDSDLPKSQICRSLRLAEVSDCSKSPDGPKSQIGRNLQIGQISRLAEISDWLKSPDWPNFQIARNLLLVYIIYR